MYRNVSRGQECHQIHHLVLSGDDQTENVRSVQELRRLQTRNHGQFSNLTFRGSGSMKYKAPSTPSPRLHRVPSCCGGLPKRGLLAPCCLQGKEKEGVQSEGSCLCFRCLHPKGNESAASACQKLRNEMEGCIACKRTHRGWHLGCLQYPVWFAHWLRTRPRCTATHLRKTDRDFVF